MKLVLFIVVFGLSLLSFSCSDACDGENPTVQLFNNGTGNADIQIKTSGGNTENINNIEVGTYSEKRSFHPGQIEFTITIQDVDDPIVYFLLIEYCTENLVLVNNDNSVSAKSIRLDYF